MWCEVCVIYVVYIYCVCYVLYIHSVNILVGYVQCLQRCELQGHPELKISIARDIA